MSNSNTAAPKGKLIREIASIAFKYRVGPPNENESQLEVVTTKVATMELVVHPVLGPGAMLHFGQARGYAEFVPVGNIRRVNYTEREEKQK